MNTTSSAKGIHPCMLIIIIIVTYLCIQQDCNLSFHIFGSLTKTFENLSVAFMVAMREIKAVKVKQT